MRTWLTRAAFYGQNQATSAWPGKIMRQGADSFAGAPVEADVAGMQRVLDRSLVSWLNHLKNAAEAAG